MKIAIAQINCTVGDFSGNAAKILDYAQRARDLGAHLMVTPELALCGYPPEDLLLRPDFYQAARQTLHTLASDLAVSAVGIAVLLGHPEEDELGRRYNAASLLINGRITATYHKHALPNEGVFDELRYFTPGDAPCVFTLEGVCCGITLCEDLWQQQMNAKMSAIDAAQHAGAELILTLNASPYDTSKQAKRHQVLRDRVAQCGLPIIYVNLIGGQDELIFDGASCVMNAEGILTHQLPAFVEALEIVEYRGHAHLDPSVAKAGIQGSMLAPPRSLEADIYDALVLGVRDYVDKNGFSHAIIGLSGGIDSALTLVIACDALGAARVRAVMMPSPYTAQMSLDDARALASNLGVHYDELTITPMFEAFCASMQPVFEDKVVDTTEENLQARIRGTMLMALSNKLGGIVLTTGNKSEMAVGYATLYGDMAGGFAVIKDVVKTRVYRLARYRNVCNVRNACNLRNACHGLSPLALSPPIPERILTRAPSAELKANQTDQDTLPPYEVLDAIIEAYVERNSSSEEIIAQGYSACDVKRVIKMIRQSEHKRRQAPVGSRITPRGLGKDWRMPLTAKL